MTIIITLALIAILSTAAEAFAFEPKKPVVNQNQKVCVACPNPRMIVCRCSKK
jgi:hypothetical protein